MQSGTYSYPGTKRVVYGMPMEKALAQELALDDARRVFVLASATLARETDLVQRLRAVLGDRCAGIFTGIGAHTPRSSVMEPRTRRERRRPTCCWDWAAAPSPTQ
jgi:maleylacetate reductase